MNQKALFRAKPTPLYPTLVRDGGTLVVVIPGLRLVSEANAHEHWRVRAKRAKSQRTTVAMVLRSMVAPVPKLPLDVTIVRTAPGRLDSDNLQGSGKHVRDGVADFIGVDDGNPGYRWNVEQTCAGRGVYSVTIKLTPRITAEQLACAQWAEVLGK